jgi:succinylglutamate desuccinylase
MKQTQSIAIDSGTAGPILTIIWGIHGNEICGVQAIDSLWDTLKLKRGKVFLMYGNTEAIERGVRQIDLNLNRMFRSDETFSQNEKETIEYKRSREIMSYLNLSVASLDLHSSPSIGSPAFIICEENCRDVVKEFPFPIRCYGFTEMEPGGTDGYMNSRGKIGICVECGNHNDSLALDKALISVQKFLEYFDMIEKKEVILWETPQQIFTAKFAYMTRTNDFRVVKIFSDFEDIAKWQLIWYDSDERVYAQNTGKILFARDRDEEGVEGFVEIIAK